MKKVVLNTKKRSSTIRLNYSNGEAGQRMREAILEHERSPHKSVTQLAGEFDIGWKSLNDRLKGNVLLNASVGKRPYLTKEEEGHLVKFLMEMADLGFGTLQKD